MDGLQLRLSIVASVSSGISWTDRSLFNNLDKAPVKFGAAMYAFTEYWSGEVRKEARNNAPWTDRTGNARQGLNTATEHGPTTHSIILFHRMPYGIWLEVRNSGAYAIILPTIRTKGREVMAGAKDLLRKMK